MKTIMLIIFAASFWGTSAFAKFVLPVPKLGSHQAASEYELLRGVESYRIGDEWGKLEATEDVISQNPALERAAMATTRTGGATGFVLGEFDGQILIGTNNHVCPSRRSCQNTSIPFLGVRAQSLNFIGSWPDIDFALYTIQVNDGDKADVLEVARNFDFDSNIYRGQPLVTSGFGVAGNRDRSMMINFDSDCRVLSGEDEFRKMADPDEFNPGAHEVWSFANGCDVSHGDSGSAMVDKNTGSPVGVIWTGKIPKNAVAQSSANIAEWEANKSEEVWEEVSYAVPAKMIKQHLEEQLDGGRIPSQHRKLIREFLNL